MLNENENLTQAAREMREARVHADVLARGEAAILGRVGRRSLPLRSFLVGATGLAALAVGVVVLTPTRASAAEILRIAANGDRALRHVRVAVVTEDRALSPGLEMDLQGGKRRFTMPNGELAVFDGHALYRRYRNGAVTIERQTSAPMGEEGSAHDLLVLNATGEGTQLAVRRGKVDRYTIDREIRDLHGGMLHLRLVLEADPKTQRPLSLRAKTDGFPERVTTWTYPKPNPDLFRPLTAPKGRVYDLDAQRKEVLRQLRSTGRKATIQGQSVELLGLWVDEFDNASAIARADYAYPEDYGLKIDGIPAHIPEKPPFSGQWIVDEPTPFEGRMTQVFGLAYLGHREKLVFPNRVNVQLPVCQGKRLLGYARFENVPVHRAYQTYFLNPDNRPFWDKRPKGPSTAVKADDASRKP